MASVRPTQWSPPVEPSAAEQVVMKAVRRAKLFVFLRLHRHEVFDEQFQAELAQIYGDRPKGQPPVPPAQLALAVILQSYTGVSDDEVIEATVMDRRWQLVLDCLDQPTAPFTKGTLVAFRARMIEANLDRRLIERTIEIAQFDAAAAAEPLRVARQIRDQDIDTTTTVPRLRRGVARDRRISVEDPDMRHGRKSRSTLFDGYKRHILTDLDTNLVAAVGITPANAPEVGVTDDIVADLHAQSTELAELHIDRAYLSSAMVRDRGEDLAIFCKAWRVRNTTGQFTKTEFQIDFAHRQLTCPNHVTMPFEPGKTVRFPTEVCATCPLWSNAPPATRGAA